MFAPSKRLMDEIAYRLVLATVGAWVFVAAVALLYIAKSALGIDMTEGHSFLHQFFYA